MPISPEAEKRSSFPEGIQERPETPTVPEYIEKGGVKKRPSDFTAQVTDDQGKPLIQTKKTKKIVIELPATEKRLKELSKGDTGRSITWFAKWWGRMIKKAIHFGWKIIRKQK